MFDFGLLGWLGLGGGVVAAALAVAWFFPPFRNIALSVAAGALAASGIYAKGNRDRAELERKRRDAAVDKARSDYAEIDSRADGPDAVDKRLRNGDF